ncbi:hypothetical protein [Chryseobacterium hagamense]|uniref:Uncharacterized protein n=1 Tax=Chryseobacterium hagamense TaxID=395935 RepID=A0A511YJ46_9FLAO|nr:hypothetical protein [Chryseobacterium hagamense]GEN75229.1 hypothetical protein CHA01nite_09690 [Chryseobacterium hagamense]
MSSVNLIAFGTFGNPNGFTQTFFAGNPLSVKTFDIRGSIRVYPDSKLYSIRKEYKDGSPMVAYAVYTYAKEPSSAREGSFIGSAILFIDEIAEENITIRCLNEFHENLTGKNVENDTLSVNHSDNFLVSKLSDFDKIRFNLKKIDTLDSAEITNKQLMVYCETHPSALQPMFKRSLDLLNVYDTIYFTSSNKIAEWVHQKNIFQFVQKDGFENEIRKLSEDRKRKILETIADFEKEKSRLGDTERQVCEDIKGKIEKNKEQHAANAEKITESEKNLTKISEVYRTFSRKIDELVNQLKTADSSALNSIRQAYKENKNVFTENIRDLKVPDLATVSEPRLSQRPEPFKQSGPYLQSYPSERRERTDRPDTFKMATFVLSLLLAAAIAGLVWLYLYPEKKVVQVYSTQQDDNNTPQQEPIVEKQTVDTIPALQAKSNGDIETQIKNEIDAKSK